MNDVNFILLIITVTMVLKLSPLSNWSSIFVFSVYKWNPNLYFVNALASAPFFKVSEQERLKAACSATETSLNSKILHDVRLTSLPSR